MNEGWTFEHLMPGWLLLCGLIASAVVVWLSIRRHWSKPAELRVLWILRALFLLLLAWPLLQPARRHRVEDKVPPRFLVLLDNSASMARGPGGAVAKPDDKIPARWATAQEVLASSALHKLADKARIEVVPLAEAIGAPVSLETAGTLKPDGRASPLGENLRALFERYKGQPLAGALLLSDGLDTRDGGGGWVRGAWPCPIHTVQLEPPGMGVTEPQLRMVSIDTPLRVFQGWETRLTAVIEGQGAGNRPVTVRLLRNGTVAEEIPVRLPEAGGRREASFRLSHPELGAETWTVEAVPLPGEKQVADNRIAVSVRVSESRNRVLYIETIPRFESKYLTRELQSNRNLQAVAVIRGPDGRFLSYGTAKPEDIQLTTAGLADCRIVVLGDIDAAALGEARARALLEFVDKGGGLVLLGGPKAWGAGGFAASALSPLLPCRWPNGMTPLSGETVAPEFTVRWTTEGLAHPAFAAEADRWTRPPPVLTLFGGAQPNQAAITLAIADTRNGTTPLLLTRRYGQGKVLALLTDSLWHWQLLPDDSRPYGRLWARIVEWMLPESARIEPFALDLTVDNDMVWLEHPVTLQTRLSLPPGEPDGGGKVTCKIQTPGGREIDLEMHAEPGNGRNPRHATVFSPAEAGQYRALAFTDASGRRIESTPCLFQVRPFTPETDPRAADDALLQTLATASGGTHGTPADIEKQLSRLAPKPEIRSRLEYESLWPKPWLLTILLTVIAGEWILRQRRGMP
jgi:hypothetical protein